MRKNTGNKMFVTSISEKLHKQTLYRLNLYFWETIHSVVLTVPHPNILKTNVYFRYVKVRLTVYCKLHKSLLYVAPKNKVSRINCILKNKLNLSKIVPV